MFRHRHPTWYTNSEGDVVWRCAQCFEEMGTNLSQLCGKGVCTKPEGWCTICEKRYPEINADQITPERLDAYLQEHGWNVKCRPHTLKIRAKNSDSEIRVYFVDKEDDWIFYEFRVKKNVLFACHYFLVNVPPIRENGHPDQ